MTSFFEERDRKWREERISFQKEKLQKSAERQQEKNCIALVNKKIKEETDKKRSQSNKRKTKRKTQNMYKQ